MSEAEHKRARASNYELMRPWQPLTQHLTADQYALMHSDKVKYNVYRAAFAAWLDEQPQKRLRQKGCAVVVVGGGFGGLVREVYAELQVRELMEKSTLDIFEINPVASDALRAWIGQAQHKQRIRLIDRDARFAVVEEDLLAAETHHKVDVVISELLGGFGDNELWPECLYPLQQCCEAEFGLAPAFIPQRTTSFAAPVSVTDIPVVSPGQQHQMFVVCNGDEIQPLTAPNTVWSFEHPLEEKMKRSAAIEFSLPEGAATSGLLGYFSVDVWKQLHSMSTVPQSRTPDLREWYPVFFPFRRAWTGTFRVCIERHDDTSRVWYSWKVSSDFAFELNNVEGRFYFAKNLCKVFDDDGKRHRCHFPVVFTKRVL